MNIDQETKKPVYNEPLQRQRWEHEPGSMYAHAIAAFASLAVWIVLIIQSAPLGARHLIGSAVFGFSLVFLYSMSTIYHLMPAHMPRAKRWMHRMDHFGIFVLIAGTYTPICLTVLAGWLGWSLLFIEWASAATGITLKMSGVSLPRWMPAALYAGMGWLGIVAIMPLLRELGSMGVIWLLVGGFWYTIGILFFALGEFYPKRIGGRWLGMHEIFHVCVMFGSAAHVYLIWRYVLT